MESRVKRTSIRRSNEEFERRAKIVLDTVVAEHLKNYEAFKKQGNKLELTEVQKAQLNCLSPY